MNNVNMKNIIRFSILACALFISTTSFSFASSSENPFSIPEDMRKGLTDLMKARCKSIPCGNGYFLRAATPDEYNKYNNDVKMNK